MSARPTDVGTQRPLQPPTTPYNSLQPPSRPLQPPVSLPAAHMAQRVNYKTLHMEISNNHTQQRF